MTPAKKTPKQTKEKRGQGRPVAGENDVGRERLLAALKCQTPDRVPISTYELVGYNIAAWENQQPS